jgi:hypothetical protein
LGFVVSTPVPGLAANFGGDGVIIKLPVDASSVDRPVFVKRVGGEDAALNVDESVVVESNESITAALQLLLRANSRTPGSDMPKYPFVASWMGMSSARTSPGDDGNMDVVPSWS